ncbi:MAG: hypothetical protein R2865_07250 [Deinococcales bacterium]
MDEILEVCSYLGQATAKIHCIGDQDSDQSLVNFSLIVSVKAWDGRKEKIPKSLCLILVSIMLPSLVKIIIYLSMPFCNGKFAGL